VTKIVHLSLSERFTIVNGGLLNPGRLSCTPLFLLHYNGTCYTP